MKDATKRILAIDYGSVRVGVAISDPSGLIARGLETIQRPGRNEPVIARIGELIREYEVGRLVLGMPLRSDDKPGEKEKEVKKFSRELQAATGLRPIFQDERYTTVEAIELMKEMGIGRERHKAIVDQIAAEIILQTYLNERG